MIYISGASPKIGAQHYFIALIIFASLRKYNSLEIYSVSAKTVYTEKVELLEMCEIQKLKN